MEDIELQLKLYLQEKQITFQQGYELMVLIAKRHNRPKEQNMNRKFKIAFYGGGAEMKNENLGR